jgi:hypothetical protein
MKIILDVAIETHEDIEDAKLFVESIRDTIERRKNQNLPGALMERSDASVWVTDVTLDGAI